MRLYLDDDTISFALVQSLKAANHDTVLPKDAGLSGASDPEHLTYAIQQGVVLLTKNYKDYEVLHKLVNAAGGHHPGILLIREDNNRKRDLKPHQVAQAVTKIEAEVTTDQCLIVNHWR